MITIYEAFVAERLSHTTDCGEDFQRQCQIFLDFMNQEHKVHKLLELYRKKDGLLLIMIHNPKIIINRDYYTDLLNKIEELEEELK